MILPAKVTYQGQTHNVLGYVGARYRLDNGSVVPIAKCAVYVEPIEALETVRSQPAGVTESEKVAEFFDTRLKYDEAISVPTQASIDILKAITKPKGGRPRKNARG
jgi:hypothetical protein